MKLSFKSLWVPLFIMLMLLTGCDIANLHKQEVLQASNESLKSWIEVPSNTDLASIQNMNTLAEIEEIYNNPFNKDFLDGVTKGKLLEIDLPLGTSRAELLAVRGEPITQGSYEGGNFYEYSDVTFFINPETDQVVAIAKQINNMGITFEDIKAQLGSPNFEGLNEMDGLWMMEYQTDGKIILFEASDKEREVEFVWLREEL